MYIPLTLKKQLRNVVDAYWHFHGWFSFFLVSLKMGGFWFCSHLEILTIFDILSLGILLKVLSLHTMQMSWVFCLDWGRFVVILIFLQMACLRVVPLVRKCDWFISLYLLNISLRRTDFYMTWIWSVTLLCLALIKIFKNYIFMCLYMNMHGCMDAYVEVRGQLARISSFYTLWVLGLSSCCQAWWQMSLPAESSFWLQKFFYEWKGSVMSL